MPQLSAGILLYRLGPAGCEVLLVHPGGPFWARKDDGAWSIPKGLIDPGEDHAAAARREFLEETGTAPPGDLVPLGSHKQPGGKSVIAFALAGELDPAAIRSNTFTMVWPPRSGRQQDFPEIDRAGWFGPDEARRKLLKGQTPILDALLARLGAS
jgi:predicted NUDIX family NTP pyrophosphohydrolase